MNFTDSTSVQCCDHAPCICSPVLLPAVPNLLEHLPTSTVLQDGLYTVHIFIAERKAIYCQIGLVMRRYS